MLSADDHPGLVYFMVGMIVLVMTGVGLSLVVDRKLSASRVGGMIEREIKTDAEQLEFLKAYRSERSRTFETQNSAANKVSTDQAQLKRKLADLKGRRSELETTRGQLSIAVPELEAEFSAYREAYRRRARAAAVGEKLGTLKIRGGREYADAVLTLVTDVGIEIRHQDGIARIQAPDLDAPWQDRFQWSDEERRLKLNEEAINHKQITQISEEKPPEMPFRSAAKIDPTDSDEVTQRRAQVLAWRSKVSRLESERSLAVSQSGSGRNSVPGSLETWQAKASRLTAQLVKASAELGVAKARLAEVSPNDRLLRDPVENSGE